MILIDRATRARVSYVPVTVPTVNEWWRIDGWPRADEWQALWAFATLVVAVVAAWLALRQYRSSVGSQLEQARPYVIVDFSFEGGAAILLEVKNVGLTAARNIRFDWSPLPVADDEVAQAAIDRTLVRDGIPFLAPGRSMFFWFGVFRDDYEETMQRRVIVTTACEGSGDARKWTSQSLLDLDQWAETMVQEAPIEKVAASLKKLADAASNQKGADAELVKAANSIHEYLEATERVIDSRARKRSNLHRRFAAQQERETRRQAELAKLTEATDEEGEP